MAVNLAYKYSPVIANVFTTSSFIKGTTSADFDFQGVKTIGVYTPSTIPLVDYKTDGDNRYGNTTELQDTVQELVMERDRAFSLSIDKGNNESQMCIKAAGDILKLQIKEQVVPEADAYALNKFVYGAGKIAAVEAPTKDNIIGLIADAVEVLDNNRVPQDERYLFVTASTFKLIGQSKEFMGLDHTAGEILSKGIIGELFGAKIVKVPASVMPADCYFIIWHAKSVIMPNKIDTAKVHEDPPGLNGALLEGRYLYDAFVIGARAGGVYSAVKTGTVQAAPAVAIAGTTATITASGADKILYTVDGSDPRYSKTAKVYSAAVTAPSKSIVKAYACKEGKFPSEVASATVA